MKSGIELIAAERQEQIKKHLRTVEDDVKYNADKQLSDAAKILLFENQTEDVENREFILGNIEMFLPTDWSVSAFEKMLNKDYKERLIIAGALIAAEIDRLNNI